MKNYIEETPQNIQEIIKLSRDKSNYKNRIKSIEQLGKYKCQQSIDKLWRLMISDKVYSVQRFAFEKLQNFGENVKLPRKRKGHLIKDINNKLIKVHASFKNDTYTLMDFKIAFKTRYPEAYDVYLYEKKHSFDNWIQQIIDISPKKKTKNIYLIEINFSNSQDSIEYFNDFISYKGANTKLDKCCITSSSIYIEAERNTIISPIDILTNDTNTIHTQITKSLLYFYIKKRNFSEIKSITVSRKKDKILETTTIPKENYQIEQVVEKYFNINENYILNNINDIFLTNDKSISLFNSLSYLVKALNTQESSHKFERLWKAFNAIYRYIGKSENDNTCHINLRDFLLSNDSLFNYSKKIVNNYDRKILRKKIQFRNLILNDYPTKNHTVSFIAFLYRYTDSRLLQILKETLPYREEFIKTINSIDKVESKFNKLGLSTIYDNCKTKQNTCIYNEIVNSLDSKINMNNQSDIEIVAFICIKYACFLRNKIFHAEKHDLSFKFIKNNLLYEIDWINNILESVIIELLNCNTEWDK